MLLQVGLMRSNRLLQNPSPNYGLPGRIYQARLERFDEVLEAVFPEAPARSYILIERPQTATTIMRPDVSDVGFYLRSVGKRAGHHRFRVEIRLDETRREAIARAAAIAARFGEVEVIEKSYGGVWFHNAPFGSLDGVRAAAQDFCRDIMAVGESDPITIGWHIAGRAAQAWG
ncbi:hypothetical protein NO357_15250 [Marimonas arenosa]|uniref:Uncharacterized protein n=2 Tax=Marimonas arenosa TaxID=1795305 RepID=A0AAE3WGH9_9RHOB|nr:hypothetical protein [Marimonas arenosa]